MRKNLLLLTMVFGLSMTACGGSSSSFSSENSSKENSSIDTSESSSSSSSLQEECTTHTFKEVTRNPSIINKGALVRTCEKCGYVEESNYTYDLDEFAFKSKTYMYDGQEKELLIEGMIPYGTTIKYENNKITEIGSKEATAKVFDENNNLLVSKTATITIVENTGLPNIRVNTTNGVEPDYHDKTNYTTMTTTVDNCESKYAITSASGGIRAR